MGKGKGRKHNIDIMFLMILFLIFTFSAVSVLLMAVNSYRSVVSANENNASARTAIAYIREAVRQHDRAGAVVVSKIGDLDCIRLSEGEGYYTYIYEYQGYLMSLEAKENSGVTADFGDKILEIKSVAFEQEADSNTIYVNIEGKSGDFEHVSIGVKSDADAAAEAEPEVEAEEIIIEEEGANEE